MRALWYQKRSSLLAVAAACAMSVFSSSARAEEPANGAPTAEKVKSAAQRLVEVDGFGKVTVPPDSFSASLSVEVRGEKLDVAREEVSSKTQSVIKALEDLRIPALRVQTMEITVSPIWERVTARGGGTRPKIVGYEATSSLSVSMQRVSPDELRTQAPRILEAALSSGANPTSSVLLFLSEPREAYRAALKESIDDAEKNARVIADAAAIKLVAWQSVSSAARGVSARRTAVGRARGTTFPVEPGELEVTAHVKARFQFVEQ